MRLALIAPIFLLAACQPSPAAPRDPAASPPSAVGDLGDPGPAGALAVARTYFDRIARRQFAEAAQLEGGQAAADDTARRFADDREVRAAFSEAPTIEGAAGSSYATLPLVIHGVDGSGKPFHYVAALTLRRANDVPGSTPEQRGWHIDRLEPAAD